MTFNKELKNILVTGGAGFIGGNLINKLLNKTNLKIHNIDFMGYASDTSRIENFLKFKNFFFHYPIDLSKYKEVEIVVKKSNPDLIIHLAAESHVDRSLNSPDDFIQSNILGTFNILKASLEHFRSLSKIRKKIFKFHHVSTDEVFGSLGNSEKFNENSKYSPRSPYSASKACSDHLVRAWNHSYELPTIITNCSNNYGPYQFPEKLIPITIIKAIKNDPIPVYGRGENIRDWIYIDDHIEGLICVASKAKAGKTYCIGGNTEIKNIDVVKTICSILDEIMPKRNGSYSSQITFVEDRPGHDYRYAIDSTLIKKELGWEPKFNFNKGIIKTINWYLKNQIWIENLKNNSCYNYERLGL